MDCPVVLYVCGCVCLIIVFWDVIWSYLFIDLCAFHLAFVCYAIDLWIFQLACGLLCDGFMCIVVGFYVVSFAHGFVFVLVDL